MRHAGQPLFLAVVYAAFAVGILCASSLTAYGVTNLVWSDEFDGTTIDTAKWGFDLGNSSSIAGSGWGNSEKEFYTSSSSNAFVTNGLLHIVARNDHGSTPSTPYSSARLHTLGKFSMTYGRVEFRAKLPSPSGYWWPALWLLATNYSDGANGISNTWPRCGEIDVMENKRGTNQVLGTIHKDSSAMPGVNQPSTGTFTFSPGDSVTNFHTYVLQWSSNSISFAVDSNAAYKVNTSWSSSTGPFPAPFNHPFYIIMNLAVGGNFVGNPSVATINAATTFPGDMQIDFVRVYQDVPGPPVVVSTTPSSGCIAGGTAITVSGSNFQNGATITIGGAPATNVVFVNANTLTAVTPGNSTGAKHVIVSNPGGSSGTLTNGFTYYGLPVFAGLGNVAAGIESATLSWSAASGVSPFMYEVWQGTSVESQVYLLTTNSLSVFIPLYPGSNSPLSYVLWVGAIDGCGNYDTNLVYLTVQPLLDPNNDQDGDGMSNGFEQQYGLNPFNATDAAADPDGDALSNLGEYLAGTDPTDKASPFHIVSIVQEGDDVRIAWADVGGRTNAVDAASEPNGSFSNISPHIIIIGTGVSVTNYFDLGATTNSPFQFYRIRLVP